MIVSDNGFLLSISNPLLWYFPKPNSTKKKKPPNNNMSGTDKQPKPIIEGDFKKFNFHSF